ncbi:MAG: alanine--tRNA ligase [Armatimonadota bacterium]|nr:alanine--tRNA ligase [Armatimonadota bacterium]
MLSSELRTKYLKFFEERGHLIYPSDSLVPDDPTLLFTSAGMVQFKPYFIGARKPPRSRITTAQKCLRTGDLEVVGTTPFHHTFFEMMGNFSFGDYFKKEAIAWAWEFLTKVLGFSPNDLWVSVYENDDEAYEIWEKIVGVPNERIVRLGAGKNYWPPNAPTEGPNGPCGPCSEIFFDYGADVGCKRPNCDPSCDCARFSEVWNLVFMQYNREEDGTLTPLPQKNIDTGLGLERVTAILQGTPTNFETDLFFPIIKSIEEVSGAKYQAKESDADIAFRVIADHIRAMVFAIADGVLPSNVGRGYVLRRIIRRAVLKGRLLGLQEPFLDRIAPVVVEVMKDPYPELVEREGHVCRTIRADEEKFLRTLNQGMQKLEEAIEAVLKGSGGAEKVLPGMEAFVLYDTYGFPLELTEEIAAEHGLRVDIQGFNEAMEEQRRKAREGSEIPSELFAASLMTLAEIEKEEPETEFVGYDMLISESKIVGILKNGELVDSASQNDEIELVLDRTPFYAESGGQVGDKGIITTKEGAEVAVEHTYRAGSLIVHSGRVTSGKLSRGERVTAAVDSVRRMATMRNHTATHLLHKALRVVLGEHVVQSGSSVDPERLRFDFTHPSPLSPEELARVESIVNTEIYNSLPVEIYQTTLEQAKEDGAMALFTEKYGGQVRVVRIGDVSLELCGGTHVSNTSQVGIFKIVSESSVGAGLRRIEAMTGLAALAYLNEREALLNAAAEILRTAPTDVPDAVRRLVENLKTAEKRISDLQRRIVSGGAEELASRAVDVNGIKLIAARVEGDAEALSTLADGLANKLKSAVVVLGAPADGKVIFVSKVTADLVKKGFNAGDIIREVAKVAGGGGGGRPDFAQAGGRDVGKLDEALEKARELVKKKAESSAP